MSAPGETLLVPVTHLVEHFGVAVAAISGVLAARGKQVDLFGVIVLGLVTAFGGGTVRDVMLGDFPVAWVRDAGLLATATSAAVITFFAARIFDFPRRLLLVADALALALITMVGVKKALGFEVAPAVAVVMGVITGVAGGILRDVLTGEIPLVFRPQIYLYATAALLGATFFVLLTKLLPSASQTSLILGATLTLVLRLGAIRWKLGLPVFTPKSVGERAANR